MRDILVLVDPTLPSSEYNNPHYSDSGLYINPFDVAKNTSDRVYAMVGSYMEELTNNQKYFFEFWYGPDSPFAHILGAFVLDAFQSYRYEYLLRYFTPEVIVPSLIADLSVRNTEFSTSTFQRNDQNIERIIEVIVIQTKYHQQIIQLIQEGIGHSLQIRRIPKYDNKLLILEGIDEEDIQRAKDSLLASKGGKRI